MKDTRTFYIRSNIHPNYDENSIIIEDDLLIILQKIELCLFTNKGDFIGNINFGCDIPFYLWETNVSTDFIKRGINEQFDLYIPELKNRLRYINVDILKGNLRDILTIRIGIDSNEIKTVFR